MTTAPVTPNEQAFYRPELTTEFKPKEPLFNAEQQKRFDKAFGKREAKLRAEYEQKISRLTVDLMDTTGLLEQLLSRSLDRLSPEDAAVIRRGIEEIRKEHTRTDARTN